MCVPLLPRGSLSGCHFVDAVQNVRHNCTVSLPLYGFVELVCRVGVWRRGVCVWGEGGEGVNVNQRSYAKVQAKNSTWNQPSAAELDQSKFHKTVQERRKP